MSNERLARLQEFFATLFPERHIYVRSSGEMRGIVLTTGKQAAAAAGIAALALWMGVCTTAMMLNALSVGSGDQETLKTKAYYERLIADRQARLNSAVAQLSDTSGGIDDLAAMVEKRHATLALLIGGVKSEPGVAQALAPIVPRTAGASPVHRVRSVLMDQDRLITQAENFADSRAERLRVAFRLAGLNPSSYSGRGEGLGGPLIEAKDPRALAAILDVDEEFAARIRNAASNMSQMRNLADAAARLPLAKPTTSGVTTSGFGVRIDPFNGRPALHSGLDFGGAMATPIYSTAPGIVSFTGVRSGYGNVVEIDHGDGFKTRYAHLSAIGVHVGERVALGGRIAAMGSTGRSTGPHLHYEVWVNGRAQNPDRFVKAGEYVREAKAKLDHGTAFLPHERSRGARAESPKVASLVADDITLEGDIKGEGELHVDGVVKGDIQIGKLTLGETGHIEGNIHAETVEARGRVIGSITAKVVRLFATAHVDGDVTHEQLSVEPGAFFQGRAQKLQRPAAAGEVIALPAAEAAE